MINKGKTFDLFYEKDKKEYILTENKEFLKWFNGMIKNGYCAFIDLESLQDTIDRIATWYELKYPERELQYYGGEKDSRFEEIHVISKYMTYEQLLFRLSHDSLCLLEGEYRFHVLKLPYIKEKSLYQYSKSIYLDSETGKIWKEDLKQIGVNTNIDLGIEQVVSYLKENQENCWIDYRPLENSIFQHNTDIELRKKILEFTSSKLLYSENTNPERGYERAKRYIGEFNKKIPNLNLATDVIDSIMKDFSKKSYQKVKK